jgi:hypothetical protein
MTLPSEHVPSGKLLRFGTGRRWQPKEWYRKTATLGAKMNSRQLNHGTTVPPVPEQHSAGSRYSVTI